jgi:hypothetical protein
MRTRPATLTELPPSPKQEQDARMRRYLIMMGIRVLCLVACLFVQGWWLLIPALGAVFLPIIAVVLANAVSRRGAGTVERPGAIERRDAA